MMDFAKLARPYAKAAFEYAQSEKQLQPWTDMLSAMASYVNEPAVSQILMDPRLSHQQHSELSLALGEKVLNEEAGKNFIKLLANNNRLTLLPHISKLFEQFRAAAEKNLVVQVKSVIPVPEEDRQKLERMLQEKFCKDIIMQYEIDPQLLGGVLIEAGDYVIDASIRGQLQRMHEALII